MSGPADAPVGLIAGSGRMPFLAAQGMRREGRKLVVVAFRGLASPRLAGLADEFHWTGITRPGHWLRVFRRRGVREAVMIGGVRKKDMFDPLRLLRYIPDLRAIKIWYFKARKDRRDNAVLLAMADELRKEGIELTSSVKYCSDHLADEGLMTSAALSAGVMSDVEFGWRIARASADLDIGQCVAVKDRDIIAVEAVEGTDAMIRRAGRLCRVGGWTLVKAARTNQDMRFDVPTVGPGTIRNLRDARCACLAVEAGRTLIVDKPATLALAEKLKIAVIGKKA
jgi:hypothetical protein